MSVLEIRHTVAQELPKIDTTSEVTILASFIAMLLAAIVWLAIMWSRSTAEHRRELIAMHDARVADVKMLARDGIDLVKGLREYLTTVEQTIRDANRPTRDTMARVEREINTLNVKLTAILTELQDENKKH